MSDQCLFFATSKCECAKLYFLLAKIIRNAKDSQVLFLFAGITDTNYGNEKESSIENQSRDKTEIELRIQRKAFQWKDIGLL